MTNSVLLKEQHGEITRLTLNRPEVHNALNAELLAALSDALAQLADDENTRVLILQANGKSFCAGADLAWMKSLLDEKKSDLNETQQLTQLLQQLDVFPKPTIALIQGAALGGGIGLLACCDIAIATAEAHFAFSETKLGLIPAIIAPYVIRAIGEHQARRYFLTAERFHADQAQQIGLVHEVTAATGLAEHVMGIAQNIIANGASALSAAKALIQKYQQLSANELISQLNQQRQEPEAQHRLKKFFK